jgi:hypothetical protein
MNASYAIFICILMLIVAGFVAQRPF